MKSKQPLVQTRDTLIHIGVADIMLNGFYKGHYSFEDLKQYGDFGIGAPEHLDGEMVMLDGKVYQTIYTGATFEAPGATKAALAFVHFFEQDRAYSFDAPLKREALYAVLHSQVKRNEPTAICIRGHFSYVCTRAFPPVQQYPAPTLQAMAHLQRYFVYHDLPGALVGYYIPEFLKGINVAGFHFHFLADDKKAGGHLVDFHLRKGHAQLDAIYQLGVLLPPLPEYPSFEGGLQTTEGIVQ
jgi:acetolactate decarboxylase